MEYGEPPAIEAIWISPGHDFVGRWGQERLSHGIHAVDSVECRAGRGLVGDRYFDHKPDFKGQVTFVSSEVIDAIAVELQIDRLDPSSVRRNILIRGLELGDLIGKRFLIQGVAFQGVEECAPCVWMNQAIGPGAHQLLRGRGGLRCRILSDGKLRVGIAEFEFVQSS